MGWLFGYVIASMVGALFVVRLFDYLFSHLTGAVVHIVRLILFVTMWTVITTRSGMRDFTARVRQLRQRNRDASKLLDAIPQEERS